MYETYAADPLRALTMDDKVQHFDEYDIRSGNAAANMPSNNYYSSLEDRIYSIGSSTEKPGNLNIVALSLFQYLLCVSIVKRSEM